MSVTLEQHTVGGTHHILKHCARCRNKCLLFIHFQKRQSARFEKRLYTQITRFVHDQFCLKKFAHGMLRYVIFRWSQTSCYHNHLRLFQGVVNFTIDYRPLVRNAKRRFHLYPKAIEVLPHPRGIRVNGLANQQLVSNIYNYRLHTFFSLFLRLKPIFAKLVR